MEILVKKYGHILSDQEVGSQLLAEIQNALKKGEQVILNFDEVKTMATFCSKQIFGHLYLKLSPEVFNEKIEFKNVNEDLKLLIKIGIQSALDEQK